MFTLSMATGQTAAPFLAATCSMTSTQQNTVSGYSRSFIELSQELPKNVNVLYNKSTYDQLFLNITIIRSYNKIAGTCLVTNFIINVNTIKYWYGGVQGTTIPIILVDLKNGSSRKGWVSHVNRMLSRNTINNLLWKF